MAYAAASLRLRLAPITWPGMGSKLLQLSKNGAAVLVYFVEWGNNTQRLHALVEIRWDWRTLVVRLSGEPPRDPNQSSALLIIDYSRLTSGKAKETHPMHVYPSLDTPALNCQ